jgi:hypothetical protein
MGYVDENLFLLKRFNPDQDLILDSSFNTSIKQIKSILMKYYNEGYFEMKLEDFLAVNKKP